MTKTSIFALALMCGGLYSGVSIAQTATPNTSGTLERASGDLVAGPTITTDRRPERGGNGGGYPKPDGVPADLHRKVVKLYKRIHNAHPDASRKRIFVKIGEELGINPRRLWNLYHPQRDPNVGPPVVDGNVADAGQLEKVSGDLVTGPTVTTTLGPDRGGNGGGYPDKPDGVPTDLHRKIAKLYKRIKNAHPDASRKRIFMKIGEELGINPRRLWNAYHTPRDPDVGPPIVDARRVDVTRDTQTRDARPAATRTTTRDRVRDRRVRDRRATRRPPSRVRRDRPARPTRPQRGR